MGFLSGGDGIEPSCQCRRPRDAGFILELERSPGGGCGNPFQYFSLPWRILWSEDPGGLQFIGLQRVGHD